MDEENQRFSAGIWIIKSGKENEFIEEFKKFAKLIFDKNIGAIEVYLVQDVQQPQRFVTFGPWESIEKIEAWRNLPEFKEFFAKAKQLSDEVTPLTMKPVMHLKA